MKRQSSISRGFTLIELLVAIVIMMMIIAGSVVYINNFNSNQKIEATKELLLTNIRLARDFAKTMQTPVVLSDKLERVEVELTEDGIITASPNGLSSNYFSKDISPVGVKTVLNKPNIIFSAFEGKLLVFDTPSNKYIPVDKSYKAEIQITSGEMIGGKTIIIEILPSGLINE